MTRRRERTSCVRSRAVGALHRATGSAFRLARLFALVAHCFASLLWLLLLLSVGKTSLMNQYVHKRFSNQVSKQHNSRQQAGTDADSALRFDAAPERPRLALAVASRKMECSSRFVLVIVRMVLFVHAV